MSLAFIVPLVYGRWTSFFATFMLLSILVFMLYSQSIITIELYHKGLDISCYMSIVCFVYAVIERLFLGTSHRSTGGMLNANYYGTIIEFVILIAVYRIITNPSKKKEYFFFIAINILGLFLCDCQSAWLAIIAGTIAILFNNGYKKGAIIFLVTSSALLSIGLMIPGVFPRWDKMPQTFVTRFGIWQIAIKQIFAHPFFGQGILAYFYNHEIYGGYRTYHSHSLFFEPFVSFGLVGVCIAIAYIVSNISYARNNIVFKEYSPIKSMVIAVMVAVLVHGVTDYSIRWIQTGLLLVFILSACFVRKEKSLDNISSGNNVDNQLNI